ncbi:unnamed protein product [Caenorhabditis bovis]|uniref:AAA+ ATPase domain-containing protein n=1 Tax=Caenorhabditis bovis TaxID=2654633 RepID=A0A8S1EV04_9PELO|nr:unnamed protein product [Caenorhabditis bovis]
MSETSTDTESQPEFCQMETISISDNNEAKNTSLSLHIEVRLNKKVPKSLAMEKLSEIGSFVNSQLSKSRNWKPIDLQEVCDPVSDYSDKNIKLENIIEKVLIGCNQLDDGQSLSSASEFIPSIDNCHIYKLNTDGPLSQSIGDEDSIIGSQLWQLPCIEFESTWENLIYDSNLKNEIISYVYALLRLSEKRANPKIINVNRLIMLIGPPGTGKTSLCKGLTQHLAIRLNTKYSHSVLVEINSHSLFSKWFSESGKLVQKMFDQIDELADDPKCMVFVLIDEVESLGMCRESSSSRSEPADAIRAVNALLTQIDRIRRRENVLILCTSNLEESLDRALVDRADIVRHVGIPSHFALYSMLKSCIIELERIGIVSESNCLKLAAVEDILEEENSANLTTETKTLLGIARDAHGLSGRAISMLPALVLSKSLEDVISLDKCLKYFKQAVKERKQRAEIA